MKRSQRYRAAAASALVALSGAAARAQTPPVDATRFEFRAPAGCSSAEDFAARVRKRSWRIRLEAEAPAAARSLLVEIQQPSAGALRGVVTVVEPDGATRTRQLKAASCEEAVDALSLIATVTLDPDAMLGEPEPSATPAPPPPKKEPPRASAPAPKPRRERAPLRVSLGLSATVLLRMAPEPAFGGTVFAGLESASASWLAPLGRLALAHAERRNIPESGGEASFAFTLPTLDLCPVRLGSASVALRPCAFASAGVVKVWGSETTLRETHTRFYGQGGAALLGLVQVSKALEIIVDGRVGLPFVKDAYGFDGVSFFTTPSPGFSASLGAAGGFP